MVNYFAATLRDFKIGNRTEAPTPAVLQKSTFCTGMCFLCKLDLKCLL